MMKDTIDTQWVNTPTRQRLATSRKRTLRSRSVRAARSVWSEYQSRIIEPRNFDDCWGLPARVRGDNIVLAAMAMAKETRPRSESRAEVYWGVPGTCENLTLLNENIDRNGMKPVEQRPGLQKTFPFSVTANRREALRYWYPSSRQGFQEGDSGSLSRLIVAFESRVTLLGRSL
jgi:hypothetical protein